MQIVITAIDRSFGITVLFIFITKRHQTWNDARSMSRVSNPQLLYVGLAKVHQLLHTNELGKAFCMFWGREKWMLLARIKYISFWGYKMLNCRCIVTNPASLAKPLFRNVDAEAVPLSGSAFCLVLKIENSMPYLRMWKKWKDFIKEITFWVNETDSWK